MSEIQDLLKDIVFECWCGHSEKSHKIDDWGLAECQVDKCECADYEPENGE